MAYWNEDVLPANDPAPPRQTQLEEALALKVRLHQRLLDMLNLSALDRTPRETLQMEIRRA